MGSGASNPKKSKYANKEQDKPRRSASTERADTLKTVKKVVQSVHEHEETCQPSDLFKAHTIRQAFPSATSTGKKISGAVPEKLCCGACGAFIVDLHGDKEFHACKNCWSFGEVFALCCTCYEGNPKWRGKWPTAPPAASRVERHRSANSLNSGNTLEPPQPGARRAPSPISGDSSDEEPGLFSKVKTPRTRREMRKKYSRRRSDPASPTGKDAEKEELIRRGSEGNLPRPSTAQGDGRPPPRPPSRTCSRPPSAPALAPTELRPDAVAKKQSIRMPSKQTQVASAAISRQSSLQSRQGQGAAAISRQSSLQSRQGPSSRPTSRQGSRQGSITSRQGSKNQSGQGSSVGSRSSSRAFGEEEVAEALAVKIRSGTWKATIHEGKGHTRSELRSLTFGADGDVEGTGPFASPIKGQHALPKVQWTETYNWGSILIVVKHQPWTTPQLWGTFQASDGGSGHIGLDFQE